MNQKQRKTVKTKKPWPTKDAMEQVYKMKLWGADASQFYSGDGSYHPEIVDPYVTVVESFLISFEKPLVVCDLGCGDFNVGKELVKSTEKYIAVDIVADLITYNKDTFKEDNLEFQCLDISVDLLPQGDCALIRQVLQHLSNAEVQRVLYKLVMYKYVILTEHIPEVDFTPNEDIISGQGTRLKKGSGLNILASPFNFKVKEERQLVSVIPNDGKGVIVTSLFTIY